MANAFAQKHLRSIILNVSSWNKLCFVTIVVVLLFITIITILVITEIFEWGGYSEGT